jgi:hypothetical protein
MRGRSLQNLKPIHMTCVKNGGSSNTTSRKQIEFSFWYNTVFLFLHNVHIMSYVDFSALIYKFQGKSMTPSCKGIGVNLVNHTNHVRRFMHVIAQNWLNTSCKVALIVAVTGLLDNHLPFSSI